MGRSKSPQGKALDQGAKFMDECIDRDGKLDLASAQALLKTWLDENKVTDNDREAARIIAQLDKARRPRVDNEQPSLFDPDALLPVGEGLRVTMAKATIRDFATWWRIETDEYSAQVQAYAAKSKYHSSRLTNWEDKHHTLEDVEREVFGWQP
jgi:hypothetical protein